MISFSEFLLEGRDAPLYHGTSLKNLIRIIDDNRLKASETHGGTSFDHIHSGKFKKPQSFTGISLTRSLKTAMAWRYDGVCLQLDQRKLAHNYRFHPINISYYWDKGENHSKYEELFEEFITEDIYPLNKYLTKIIVNEDGLLRIKGDVKRDITGASNLLNHPLLWDIETRKFINK